MPVRTFHQLTAYLFTYYSNQLANREECGGDPLLMLEKVRNRYGASLDNALFGMPGANRGRMCLPYLMQYDRAYKHGSLDESMNAHAWRPRGKIT